MQGNNLSAPFLVFLFSSLCCQCCTSVNAQVEVSFPKVDEKPLSHIPEDAILLYDDWQMKESSIIGMNGEKISTPGYKLENWYPTTVPTTVLGTLVRNGIYPDPYIGMNNMKIPDVNDAFNKRYNLANYSHLPDGSNPWLRPYWFRKEFKVPGNYSGKVIWLNLDGINYRADVWINGKLVADSTELVGMFKRFRLNITEYINPGKTNIVAIAIHQLDFPGDPVSEQLGSLKGDFGPNSGDGETLRNVTQYTTAGWDWIPAVRDRNIGIWQHVSISATGPVVVADPAAFTVVNIKGEVTADLTIRFFVSNSSKKDQSVDLQVNIQNPGKTQTIASISQHLNLEAESRREIILRPGDYAQLTMKNPDLWWPVNYGAQPLYCLNVVAKINGQVSSKAASRFGVREVSSYILPSGGRAFAVNGRPVRIVGGAWISDFLLSWSAQRYRDEVRLMADGNATIVRVNGCNIMPPDIFFDACDEYGLLVWQDFSRTSATGENSATRWDAHPKKCDSKVFMDNMIDFISRARGHCSILLWCGSNEAVPQEDISKALQDQIIPKMDESRIFIISSDEQPSWSKIDINTFSGGPWNMVRIPRYYELYDTKPEFTSKNEIGLPSLPPINSLAAGIPDFNEPWDEFFPLNQSMSYHDAVGGGNGRFGDYVKIMHEDIGKPSSIAEMLKWGDLYNNQVYRTIFEAANRARPRNNLTTLWKSNAAWLSFFWQIFDWYLRPNAGYYTMKSAIKPVHVQYSHIDKGIQVVSTLDKDIKVKIKASVIKAEGTVVGERSYSAAINANKTVYIDSIPDIIKDTSLYFIALDLMDDSGEIIDRTVTWTQKNAKWQELLSIPVVDLEAQEIHIKEIENEMIYSLNIHNQASIPAVNIVLELTDGTFGKEILPAFWSDNALTLMPGETKTVEVKVRKGFSPDQLHVLAEGLNVAPVSWNIVQGSEKKMEFRIENMEIRKDNSQFVLHFSTNQPDNFGTRITTGPVKLTVDGKLYRYVSVAVRQGMNITGKIELSGIKPGKHKINMGNSSIDVTL
jgi:exo-1,4-beta-D-glucosaminidase